MLLAGKHFFIMPSIDRAGSRKMKEKPKMQIAKMIVEKFSEDPVKYRDLIKESWQLIEEGKAAKLAKLGSDDQGGNRAMVLQKSLNASVNPVTADEQVKAHMHGNWGCCHRNSDKTKPRVRGEASIPHSGSQLLCQRFCEAFGITSQTLQCRHDPSVSLSLCGRTIGGCILPLSDDVKKEVKRTLEKEKTSR